MCVKQVKLRLALALVVLRKDKLMMNKRTVKARKRRAMRVHVKIRKNTTMPRLSVYRSLSHFYAQVIDDQQGKTLVACSTLDLENVSGDKKNCAHTVGVELAKRAVQKGIARVAFDRGRCLYHGRIKAFADGAREGGLQF